MSPEQRKVVDRITNMLQGVEFTASEGLYLESEFDFVEVVTERRPPKSDNVRLRIHIGDYWLSSAIAWLRDDALDDLSRTFAGVVQKGNPTVSSWATTVLRNVENRRKYKCESPYAKVPFRLRRRTADRTEAIAGEYTNAYGNTYIDGAQAQDLCSIEVVREVADEVDCVVTLPPRLPVAGHVSEFPPIGKSAAATTDSQQQEPLKFSWERFNVVLEHASDGRTSVAIQSSDTTLKGKVMRVELNGAMANVELRGNRTGPSCSGRVVVAVSFEGVRQTLDFRIINEDNT